MAHRKTERNPLFAGRWFEDEIILLCLRWYFRFKLSYRDLVEMLSERGLIIAHTTILRWGCSLRGDVPETLAALRATGRGSWRADETFIKIRGQLMYLYRAVDAQRKHRGVLSQSNARRCRRQSIFSQGTEASS